MSSSRQITFYFLLVALATFSSCAKRPVSSDNSVNLIVFPDPPDTARIQYLTSFRNSRSIEKKQGFFKKYIFGVDKAKPVFKPYGASFNNGKIYICDLDLEGLEIIDLTTEKFEYFIPKGLGKLKLPINCSFDSAGNLLVSDAVRRQIVVFNNKLEYLTAFGLADNFKPTDVAAHGNKILVSNVVNGSVDVFSNDSAHKFLYSIPDSAEGEAKLYQPTNIFVTEEKIYVSDFGDFKIKIYNHKGEFIRSVGTYGKNVGQFARPKGVAVDRDNNLYVVDAAFENVQVFNDKGDLLMFFGGSNMERGGLWLPAKVAISYENNDYFKQFVDSRYKLNYVILVTNNFGPDKISVYGSIAVK